MIRISEQHWKKQVRRSPYFFVLLSTRITRNYYSISKNLRNRFGSRCPRSLRYLDYPIILSFLPSNQRKRGSSRERTGRENYFHAPMNPILPSSTLIRLFSFFPLLFSSKFSKKNSNLSEPSPPRDLQKCDRNENPSLSNRFV